MKYLEVVAACLIKSDRFLLCRRPLHKARGGQWEFPGGKVEPGETKEQAIERELREELGVEIRADGVLAQVDHGYPDLNIRLTLMKTSLMEGVPRLLEHSELKWVTMEEVGALDLCPADRLLLKQLRRREKDGI